MDEPTSPNEQDAGSPSAENDERLLKFSPSEVRLLIITIIGTVAGTLIAVLAVGLAIWLIRIDRFPQSEIVERVGALTAFFLTALAYLWLWLYGPARIRNKKFRGLATYLFWLVIMGLGFASLMWIGIAAGISK